MLDEFWDIKSANDCFFDYIGGNKYQSLVKFVKEGQEDRFSEMFSKLDKEEVSDGIFDLLDYNNEYNPVYFRVKYKNVEKKYYEIKLWNIRKSEDIVSEVNFSENKLKEILTACNDICFEYNRKNDEFKLFTFNGTSETINYSDTFTKWKENVIKNNYIEKGFETQFEKFCSDLKFNNRLQNEYCYKGSIFSNGSKNQNIKCLCRVVKDNNHQNYVVGVIRAYRDDTLQNENVLFSETSRDFLTGVLNKMTIKKYCEDKIAEAPNYMLCMCIVDVDNFKDVNDNFGHMFGDEVLSKVANIITNYVGQTGKVGRIGGDEFFIFFESIKNLDELRGVLRAIRSSVQMEYDGKLNNVNVTLSIGASIYPEYGTTYDELFKIADKALYIAKDKGKNRYIIYNRDIHGDIKIGKDNRIVVGGSRGGKDYSDLMVNVLSKISSKGFNDFNEVLKEIKEGFSIDRVNLYYGDELKLKYSSDDVFDENKSAICLKNPKFISKFNKNNELEITHIESLSVSFEEVHSFYKEDNVFSVIHCIIGTKENVKGIITFERYDKTQILSQKWSNEESKNFTYISCVLNNLF